MATAPISPVMSDEYLNSAWHPDMEFVDGQLIERGMPTFARGALQLIIGEHLRKYRRQYGYGVATECRVEIVERSRYRVPDVLICPLPVNVEDKALRARCLSL